MVIYNKSLVDVPDDDGVHIKVAGAKNEKYVYKHVKYYRNSEGKPRNQSKSIGKFDESTGKMYPNSNYFSLYKIEPEYPEVKVWDYGYSYLVLKACQDMGLLGCLENAFGAKAMDIIVIAAYIIREGSALDGIDDWQERNYFPGFKSLLTSQATSKIFSMLTDEQRNTFFSNWVKTARNSGTVCYDVTSISSYAQHMPSVEHGYNRDGEKLAQFNLGLFCDENTKVPLYYNRYSGSLTDKVNLSYVLENAKAVGIDSVKMLLDGSFWDEKCFEALNKLCSAFTVGMSANLNTSKDILENHAKSVAHYANRLSIPHTFCIAVDTTIWGIAGKALLYFDEMSHAQLCEELVSLINRLSAELSKLKRYPSKKLNRYDSYFNITKREGGFDFTVDTEKVDRLMKRKGMFLIFTTDMDATAEDILFHYRAKDVVEKMFDQIKCEMEGNRVRTHNEKTTDGKVFVVFIACVIRSYILQKLSQHLKDNSTSLKKVFSQLSNITIISAQNGLRFTNALTKKHKLILKPFNAQVAILTSVPSSEKAKWICEDFCHKTRN